MMWLLGFILILLTLALGALVRLLLDFIELTSEVKRNGEFASGQFLLLTLEIEKLNKKETIVVESPPISPCRFSPGSESRICAIREADEKGKDEKTFIREAPRWIDKSGSSDES